MTATTATTPAAIRFFDFEPRLDDFRAEVLRGLASVPKQIPPKFFYDKRGSGLFERICELDEYYPTRTEISILEENAAEIAGLIGEHSRLIEYGSGNSRKIRILLDALGGRHAYVAIDISKAHLIESASRLAEEYPELEVMAVCADYGQPFRLPMPGIYPGGRDVAFFPGSTIGNFSPGPARRFLANTARAVGPGGGLLIGADLKKDPAILHAAYNDAAGVTAEFNLNLLARINAEAGADFDLGAFRHDAFYNLEEGRIEMHLVSLKRQTVRLNGSRLPFEEGETIHTENSYKFELTEFRELAASAGFVSERVWTDAGNLFSLHYLVAK
jgi:dimethylhistidine N-methyltransferase